MNTRLLSLLRCPHCTHALVVSARSMSCGRCHISYEIRMGIPILVDLSSLPPHLASQVRYFEKEDQTRVDWMLEPWQRRYLQNFLTFGKPKKGALIIDDATGSGYMTIELARRGFAVIATDLTFRELLKLKQNLVKQGLAKNVLLICCDSQQLPIVSRVADGLVANAILEHLPRERQAIDEIRRVVRKGAPVMIALPLAYRLLLPILWLPNWLHDKKIGHLRRYTRRIVLRKFPNFTEIVTYYTGSFVKVMFLGLAIITGQSHWQKYGERMDEWFERIPYGASNIVTIFRKV